MKAYIFDVDGVITDPVTKIPNEEVLEILANKLENNQPIGFNTGRSIKWVYEKIITIIESKLKNKGALNNLFVSAEFGGTWLEFDQAGKVQSHIDGDIKVPDALRQRANDIGNKFSSSMFHNDSEDKKETMVSSEMLTNFSIEKYHQEREKLFVEWQKLLNELGLESKYKVTKTMVGTDLVDLRVGKEYSTAKVLAWFRQNGVDIDETLVFGDSELDALMAEECVRQNLRTTFVFVGNSLQKTYPFPIVRTGKQFSEGTLEYLLKFS